jgi:hypothetical protein
MSGVELSSFEASRIGRILQSAMSGSWEEFAKLTDEPFASDVSMREQFDDSSKRLRKAGGAWIESRKVEIIDDGTRLIFVTIENKQAGNTNILLSLHSTSDMTDSVISIWTFFQQLDWRSLLDA